MLGDKVNDLALALDAAVDRHHPGRNDHPALLLEHLRPDHEIGDAGLVLDGDEHDAFRRARHLPHEHEAGGLEPAAVAGLHRLGARDDALAAQVSAQETDRMVSQGQPYMTIILDHLAAGGHGAERHRRFAEFRHGFGLAGRGGPGERRRAPAGARISGTAPASRAEAAAKSGSGSSRNALIAQSASRRASRNEGRKASASASCTSDADGTQARRQRSSIEAKGWSALAATMAAASALARLRTIR